MTELEERAFRRLEEVVRRGMDMDADDYDFEYARCYSELVQALANLERARCGSCVLK